jgi:hypothetical protein
MDLRLAMHLRHQGTGRVDREKVAMARFRRHRLGNAMRREDHRTGCVRNLRQFLDKDRALGLQRIHDVAIVDDLVADIDGRTKAHECLFNDVDGAHDPGAESARRTKQNAKRRFFDHRFRHVGLVARGPCTVKLCSAQE